MHPRRADVPRPKAHVALFDAATLTAKGVREQLLARSFPIASVRLYASRTDPDSNLTEFGGEAMLVTAPDIDALGRLDIAFLCGARQEGALYLDWASRKGFVAIDLTTASNDSVDVPLVNAAVNPQAIPGRPGLIAAPHPIALLLSSLLAPLLRGCGLTSAATVVFQPASECGEEGIEELYQQTMGLLNFSEVPVQVFWRQLAFNLIPSSQREGGIVPGAARPAGLEREVLKVIGGGFGLSVEVVLVPVFHCHAALARVVLPAGTGQEALLASYAGSEEIQVDLEQNGATPAEQAGKQGILIAGVRPAGDASAYWIWAVTDNLESGSALNAVRIAERLLERGVLRDGA